jgi:hypothetical protein
MFVTRAKTLAGVLSLLLLPHRAVAQGSGWEIEGQIGVALTRTPTSGSIALPPPGSPITTSSPTVPSRAIPSWLFGDGTSLLNNVLGQFGVPLQVTPIEAGLASSGGDTASALALSARVRRRWRPRWWIEGSLDFTTRSSAIPGDVLAAMEATRASFADAFRNFLLTGPLANIVVDATGPAISGSSSRTITATGALLWRFGALGGWMPYATFGGGVTTSAGDPAATLDADYRFTISVSGVTPVPIAEHDHVAIRASEGTTWVGVAGGGLRRDVSARWGIAVDGRVLIGPNRARLALDASPSAMPGTPADHIETFTSPAIQFSNEPPGGRVSTLSAPALTDFELTTGDGLRTRVLITGGVFWRF